MQVDFQKKECMSSTSNLGDELVVTFYAEDLFVDDKGYKIPSGTQIRKHILRQLDRNEDDKTGTTVLEIVTKST